jgi:hypothetical protein
MFRAAVLLAIATPALTHAAEPVDFERHVVGLLGRAGCSAGACHGSFQGKGGLRLSLFGSEPDKDFIAITRGGGGRRVNPADPDNSLLLLKATGRVSHAGGMRFAVNSPEYRIIRAWVAGGCRHTPGSGAVTRLEVRPAEHTVANPGEAVAFAVRARYADGTEADVTAFCELRVKDDSIADVSHTGEVRGLRPGDTAIIATYRGQIATARLLVPFPGAGAYPDVPAANLVDREVFAKLRRLNVIPSELSSDAEFLRRVTIDTTGGLPTPDEVRAFVADRDPHKREKLIDRLLSHPLHAAVWATKFCDVTACNTDAMDGPPELRGKRAQLWHDWFRRRLAANVPYDRIARGVLVATSREGRSIPEWIAAEVELDQAMRKGFDTPYPERESLDLFWRRFEANEEFFPLEKMAELTATAFLGIRLECAQCHKHPFDRWTQTDYRAFANTFGRVRFDSSPELTAAVVDLLEERRKLPPGKAGPPIPRLREVYLAGQPRRLPHPETGEVLPPRALGGPQLDGDDPREALAAWMTRPDNPFFARAFVNRVWAHYFGVGLVDPVDDLSASNPPSNARLLDALADEFVRSGFDVRRLERLILTSRTYQLSSTPNDTNRRDRTNFARSYPRPLMAEAVLDVLNDALGAKEDFGSDARPGSRAVEVGANRVRSPHAARVFRVFGRPARTSTCDCERPSGPALPQTLFLMSDPVLLKKMSGGRLERLVATDVLDPDAVDELFLATLCRFPDEGEQQAALERLKAAPDRRAGLTDVLWALINTREFILNH